MFILERGPDYPRPALDDVVETRGRFTPPPLGSLRLLGSMASTARVVTDPGGIQEEAPALGVPYLTPKDSTKRPATIDSWLERLVGTSAESILRLSKILAGEFPGRDRPLLWGGRTAERIIRDLTRWVSRDHEN